MTAPKQITTIWHEGQAEHYYFTAAEVAAARRSVAPAAADILDSAAELLDDGRGWNYSAAARDADGNPCSALSPDAVCWNGEGAVARAEEMYVRGRVRPRPPIPASAGAMAMEAANKIALSMLCPPGYGAGLRDLSTDRYFAGATIRCLRAAAAELRTLAA